MERKGRGRVRIEDRFEIYRQAVSILPKEVREFLELFRPAIREGIEAATKWDMPLDSLDSYDEKKEILEYEEILFFIPAIIEIFNIISKKVNL